MSTDSPVRVLLLVSNAQLRERAATALGTRNFLFDTNLEGAACGDAWQVLVTDRCVEERFVRERAGRENCAVVGIAVAENVDVQLPEDFTGRELRIAVQLVSQIAALRAERNQLAEAHSAVRELAETDPLTGLPNRRAWERQVPALLAQSQRNGEPAWLALIDLDGFKQINDQRGMNRGDQVLTQCAQSLAVALRRDDLVARLGGDEFGVLLVGVNEDRVLEIFERLRASIAAGGEVTASFGVIAAATEAGMVELLRAAEIAMRTAKQAGGDRVVRSNYEASSNEDLRQ